MDGRVRLCPLRVRVNSRIGKTICNKLNFPLSRTFRGSGQCPLRAITYQISYQNIGGSKERIKMRGSNVIDSFHLVWLNNNIF